METKNEALRRQELLVSAAMMLASELSLPALLQRMVELAADLAGARYVALGVVSPAGGIEQFITHGLSDEERARIGDIPRGHGILGVLITDARPLRLKKLQDHPRSVGFPPNHPPMTSFLGAPVAVRGQVFGNLYLTEKIGADEFTPEDEDAIEKLAVQAGVAIELTRAQEELHRLALIEERERIAKELHDDVIQSLFAEGMALQAAHSMAGDRAAVEARLTQSVENIDRVIRDLRNYIFGLRPGVAADRQLDRALRELAAGFAQGSVATIEVETDPDAVSRLASRVGDVVQAAREALSNAVRHSGADTISVTLLTIGSTAVLEVSDNGTGFDPGEVQGKGQGLGNLRARAAQIGGELEIESEAGRGTWLRIRIPL
jgi:two-component system, NarL family, sensor histidine kinase DevS